MKTLNYFLIGVMSGTSLDGLDLTYVKFSKKNIWQYKIFACKTYKYSANWRRKLKSAMFLSKIDLMEFDKN